jgi:hypothetical protein
MNLNKPFYLSMTIISALVSGVAQLLNLFGVSIADLVPAITEAIGKEVNATVSIAGVVLAIIGRFRARKTVTLGPTPSSTTRLLLASAVAGMASVTLVACSAQTYTYTPAGASTPVTITGFGAWCENNLATIRSATKSSVLILAQKAIKQATTAQRIASDIRAVEAVLQPLLSQGTTTQADLDNALAKVKVNDTDGVYANAIEPAITLVGGYLVTLVNENTPTKVTTDVLNALNNGLDDAAVSLDPTTTTTN